MQPSTLALFNFNTSQAQKLDIMDNTFCSAHLLGTDGNIYIFGGDNYDPFFFQDTVDGRPLIRQLQVPATFGAAPTYTVMANMSINRWKDLRLLGINLWVRAQHLMPDIIVPWCCSATSSIGVDAMKTAIEAEHVPVRYPVAATLPNGSIAVAGSCDVTTDIDRANQPSLQVYTPGSHNVGAPIVLPVLDITSTPDNTYPYMAVLPHSGSIIVIAADQVGVYDSVSFQPDPRYGDIPPLPVSVTYPQSASVVLLPLDPNTNYTTKVKQAPLCQ